MDFEVNQNVFIDAQESSTNSQKLFSRAFPLSHGCSNIFSANENKQDVAWPSRAAGNARHFVAEVNHFDE